MFELLIGFLLFPIIPNEDNNSHILMMISTLGPLPERYLSQAYQYFQSNGEQSSPMANGPDLKLFSPDLLETLFHRKKCYEFDAGKEESAIDILKQILRYKPEKKSSVEKLLSHLWFTNIGT